MPINQVTFLETPTIGKRIPFVMQNNQQGVTSPVSSVDIDPATNCFRAITQSGSVYIGLVHNISNQTVFMNPIATHSNINSSQSPYNNQQPQYPQTMQAKQRTTAIILAWLLGGLGIHRIYLGDTLLGFIYMLFCWTFIPAIIAFIEGIIYACMSDLEFDTRYNQPR